MRGSRGLTRGSTAGVMRAFGALSAAALMVGLLVAPAHAGGEEPARRQARNGAVLYAQSFDLLERGVAWADGTSHGDLKAVYDGYGTTQVAKVGGDNILRLRPRAATSADVTHAGLAVTEQTFVDIDLTLSVRTAKQLRSPAPNPWETAWTIWNYRDNTHFYYLALKPNGWELGKEDPAYPGAQRFLATGSNIKFPIGKWNSVRVRQAGPTITVWANGTKLTSFTDTERPYLSGAVGIYCEDSEAQFDDIVVGSLED